MMMMLQSTTRTTTRMNANNKSNAMVSRSLVLLTLYSQVSIILVQALSSSSSFGADVLNQARRLDDAGDFDFVGDYSIKFQGCHHVQQWNDYADDENDVRIKTKRLARFRLCPSDQCSNDKTTGCTSKFGDYIVDMNTFVYNYLQELEEQKDNFCAAAATDCQSECGSSSEGDECTTSCYAAYSLSVCLYDEAAANDFDVLDFASCAEMDDHRRRRLVNSGIIRHLDEDVQYYIGPHCSQQGGQVHLGVFTDDTCTTMAESGDDIFYAAYGFNLPYSSASMISSRCVGCLDADDNDADGSYVSELCQNVYKNSGKCETRMAIDYPNESSCDYIEGIKVIREDGVIRTSSVRKSKSAAVAIGVFMTLSVLLAGYVFYLRTKLGRAQINLAASAHPLN
jgi:hypothetical protein